MNLRWNGSLRRFEAEFVDFQGDLSAVKAAGFKTDGPPEWIWYSYKVGPLIKLRGNRPLSGLTITAEAKEQYVSLAALEESNSKVKAELAAHQKEQKKKLKAEIGTALLVIPEKGYIEASDLPLMPKSESAFVPPTPPATRCIVCLDPVYFFELQNPPTCLWCEKIVLDNSGEVC
jgi:hypothetical protein